MKKKLLQLCFGLLFVYPVFAQKGFKNKYELFRFALHGQLNPVNPARLSTTAAQSIGTFLQENAREIPGFMISQLEIYERERVEDPAGYTALPETDLKPVRESAMLLSANRMLTEMQRENVSRDDMNNLSILLKFLSVNPIELVRLVNSQLSSQLFLTHVKFPPEKLASVYAQLSIAGSYLCSRKLDKDHWTVTLNSYYLVNTYSVNVSTGEIDLTEIKIRK